MNEHFEEAHVFFYGGETVCKPILYDFHQLSQRNPAKCVIAEQF